MDSQKKSRQEEAYEYVSKLFVKLLEKDDRISYEHKRSVIAFWEDLFAHDGVKNNMVQAFSNFLWEIDKRNEAARKAGIMMALSRVELDFKDFVEVPTKDISTSILNLLKEESDVDEEIIDKIATMDLSEVGGGDEDETPAV